MILFLFGRGSLGRGGTIWLASLARRKSSKSVVHQLASTAHIPTKLSQLANGTYRLVISRELLPAHSAYDRVPPCVCCMAVAWRLVGLLYLVAFCCLQRPIFTAGYDAMCHCHTCEEECTVVEILSVADRKTGVKKRQRFAKEGAMVTAKFKVGFGHQPCLPSSHR